MLRIYPLPTLFDDTVALLKADTPVQTSSFFVRRAHTVPWSINPTLFQLETSTPDEIHEVTVNDILVLRTVPGNGTSTVNLPLEKGANHIVVSCLGQVSSAHVAATAVESWFRGLGRAFYGAVSQRLNEFETALAGNWTTRLSGHLLPYSDLFLPSQMPRLHQTRLAVITTMGHRLGHGDGVMQIGSAVYYCTPHVSRSRDSEFMAPEDDMTGISSAATINEMNGRVFDVWTPNVCAAASAALVLYVQNLAAEDDPNPPPLALVDVGDRQVLLAAPDGTLETHNVDPLDPTCSAIDSTQSSCDDSARVFLDFEEVDEAVMLSPQVPFDRIVERPINFGFFDSGTYFDASAGSELPGIGGDDHFDTIDVDDPLGTGFLGVSLSRRFDNACLDTTLSLAQRLAKFAFPLSSVNTDWSIASTVYADVAVGAPSGAIGTTSLWVKSASHWLNNGDRLRTIDPYDDLFIVSVWPVFNGVVKTAAVTVTAAGPVMQVAAPAGFFEQRHQGCGFRVGLQQACIVSVSTDGTTARIAGNTGMPLGAGTGEVYLPVRDRQSTDSPGYSGYRVFELTLGDPLPAQVSQDEMMDVRVSPRAVGAWASGSTYVEISADMVPSQGDVLYVTDSLSYDITAAIPTGSTVGGWPVYALDLGSALVTSLSNGQALYAVRTVSCFEDGDPVTPLSLLTLRPTNYIAPNP